MKYHVLLALASVFSLVACDPDHTTSVDSGSGAARLSLVAAPLAAPDMPPCHAERNGPPGRQDPARVAVGPEANSPKDHHAVPTQGAGA